MADHFDPDILHHLADLEEIEIETVALDQPALHRTTIWIVTVGSDLYVRSYKGPRGRWYQQIRANPIGAIFTAEHRIPVSAVPVADDVTNARVSEAYLRKYHTSEFASAMVTPDVLPTTLRLDPIPEA